MRKSPMFALRLAGALARYLFVFTCLVLAPFATVRADTLARGGVSAPIGAGGLTCDDASCATGYECVETQFGPRCVPSQICPVAIPGGPYSGLVGAPVDFDGSASSDPDGEPLTFAWDFDTSNGIGGDALGPTPVHTYESPGIYTVLLTVTAGNDLEFTCSNSAATTANIGTICPATVINGYDSIRLSSGRAVWFASVQPAGGCYANTDVILTSFNLKYAGRQIAASAVKSVAGDKNGDGIEELCASFAKSDLKTLFAGARLGNGQRRVSVLIEAKLQTGGLLQGTTQVELFHQASATPATVSPNPFNPSTTLTFTTARAGGAKVAMFDIAGRLVRTLLDEPSLAPGVHEVRIEGRGERGEPLPSGVYFIRGATAEEEFTKSIALLK